VKGEVPPQLVFASDRPTEELGRLISHPRVISDLKKLKAGIALALPDLTEGRAQIVRTLNQAGVPITAWLAFPTERGYYFNAGNASKAAQRFVEFENWTAANDLHWAGVGLDIEPDIREFAALRHGSKWRLVATLIRRYFEVGRVQRARQSYAELIREIQAKGYPVQTYHFPFLADERQMHSTLLERLSGIVDVRGNLEVLMIYSSFNHALDSGLIWAYGPDAQAIAVGSTLEHFHL
jgi:hypothetical protein